MLALGIHFGEQHTAPLRRAIEEYVATRPELEGKELDKKSLEKVVETLQQDLESKAHRIVNPQEADAEVQELPWMNDSQLPCAILIC